MPSGHDGSLPFSFRLSFSEEVALSYQDFSGALFEISGGTVRNARRLVRFSNKSWEVHARPDGTGTVVITLPGDRACDTAGAVCNSDGDRFTATVTATVPGPAPSVTSATALTVAEGATAVATLTATDADTGAEGLTWSIPGGADAPKFAITTDGALSFTMAKDFENPDDSGGDGTYEVTVQVSDGVRSSTADLRVTLIDVNEAPTADAGNDQQRRCAGGDGDPGSHGNRPRRRRHLDLRLGPDQWGQRDPVRDRHGHRDLQRPDGTHRGCHAGCSHPHGHRHRRPNRPGRGLGHRLVRSDGAVRADAVQPRRFHALHLLAVLQQGDRHQLQRLHRIGVPDHGRHGEEVAAAAPPSNIGWEIPVGPGGDDNVVITLPGNRACAFPGRSALATASSSPTVYPPP